MAETIGELDKSRLLLITQVKINDDYKKEVFLIQSKMEENKAEYDAKILEYAQLLDIRAARIKVSSRRKHSNGESFGFDTHLLLYRNWRDNSRKLLMARDKCASITTRILWVLWPPPRLLASNRASLASADRATASWARRPIRCSIIN